MTKVVGFFVCFYWRFYCNIIKETELLHGFTLYVNYKPHTKNGFLALKNTSVNTYKRCNF